MNRHVACSKHVVVGEGETIRVLDETLNTVSRNTSVSLVAGYAMKPGLYFLVERGETSISSDEHYFVHSSHIKDVFSNKVVFTERKNALKGRSSAGGKGNYRSRFVLANSTYAGSFAFTDALEDDYAGWRLSSASEGKQTICIRLKRAPVMQCSDKVIAESSIEGKINVSQLTRVPYKPLIGIRKSRLDGSVKNIAFFTEEGICRKFEVTCRDDAEEMMKMYPQTAEYIFLSTSAKGADEIKVCGYTGLRAFNRCGRSDMGANTIHDFKRVVAHLKSGDSWEDFISICERYNAGDVKRTFEDYVGHSYQPRATFRRLEGKGKRFILESLNVPFGILSSAGCIDSFTRENEARFREAALKSIAASKFKNVKPDDLVYFGIIKRCDSSVEVIFHVNGMYSRSGELLKGGTDEEEN